MVAINGENVQGGELTTHETTALPVILNGRTMWVKFDIAPIAKDIVLGVPWLQEYNPDINWKTQTITWRDRIEYEEFRDYPKDIERVMVAWVKPGPEVTTIKVNQLPQEYHEYKDVFDEPSDENALPQHKPWDHSIPLEPGTEPKFMPIYSLSQNEAETLEEYIKTKLKKGHIRPSQSPAGYPILFVPKKNGKLRLCVDYRQLNSITIKNRYALPLIPDLRDKLHGAQWFTTIDLRDAYSLVRIKEGEEWKTAFRTKYGHYEYLVMPFGLTNAPATFQALVNDTLRGKLDICVVVYLDDILVFSMTHEQHTKDVKWVLDRLREKDLKAQLEKCEFHKTEVSFLGFKVGRNGVSMQEDKTAAIRDWAAPTKVKEVQEFLGFCNFYRSFIKDYSKITAPLTNLTKKDQVWNWGPEAEAAFKELKAEFAINRVMAPQDPEKQGIVETDASDAAMGAVYSQVDERGKLRPVAFFSKKFSPAELNYEIHDKELLAIVATMREWRHYLEGAKHQVIVYTDHQNLSYFTTTKQLTRRQARWSEALSSFNFVIKYRKGSENERADALSRKGEYMREVPKHFGTILQETDEGLVYNRKTVAVTLIQELGGVEKEIKQAYAKDTTAQRILGDLASHPSFEVREGLLLFHGLIYLPETLRTDYVSRIHSLPMHGHQGIAKTAERVSRDYYFPGLKRTVEKVLAQCHICKVSKSERHQPYGKLQPNKAPTARWQVVTMDFIVKLPKSKDPLTKVEYDSILVIVDRLTKYSYFVPYLEASDAEQLANTILRVLVSEHGMPEEFITDRDKLFTSTFWKSLMTLVGTHHKLSTSFHPQTDGQTERINQIIEQYLRSYIDYQQTNWVAMLPMAQFSYNSSPSETTKVSPFEANYGYCPAAYHEPRTGQKNALYAQVNVDLLKWLHTQLSLDIQFYAERSAHYYNKGRLEGPRLKEGDKVYLSRRNIKTTRPSAKLDYKKIGPFEILEVIGVVNYKLKLPANMNINPVFHISLLELAPKNAPVIAPDLSEDNEIIEYEVEEILDQAADETGQPLYRVRWKGHNEQDDTWEPRENLQGARSLLQRFLRQKQGQTRTRSRAQNQKTRRDRRKPRG
jgi:hypothetical protein